MKKNIILLFSCLLALAQSFAQKPIVFSENDDYVIVVAENSTTEEVAAAKELQHFLGKIFSRKYEICVDQQFKGTHAISIGKNKLSSSLYNKYAKQIHDDGFLLHTDGKNLYILGPHPESERNGVYHFLENYLGCNYTTAGSITFETMPEEVILSIHNLQNPSFRYRETLHYLTNTDSLYAKWHKLHNRKDFNEEWGLFVHTFQTLIPVDQYYDAHPEWFSELNGRRVRDGQLCLSNPEVLEELCRNLETRMQQEPKKQIWSVSQNDNESSCTCEKCRHLDSLYGGPSGTMIWFVNQVAARFPDKTISTLAYQQTRRPPRNIKPADNVNIMLCSIECQRTFPIDSETGEHSFQRDMEGWTALTHNIFLWDYVVQFRNYLDPFPNFHILQPNLQNFHRNGIQMIFEQGSSDNITESHEWRTYLLSHLLWNVNIDVDSLRNRFLDVHYGENRSVFIKQYYDVMTDALLNSKQKLDIYGYPMYAKDGYLSPEKIKYYQSLFQNAYKELPTEECTEAERKVYDDRLRLLELSLDFAVLDMSMNNLTPELTFFQTDKDGKKQVRKEMYERAERFISDCKRLGVKKLDEAKYTPEQFLFNIQNHIKKSTEVNVAEGKQVSCRTQWSPLYDVGGPKALTDGIIGPMNYHYNWLGFWGDDMDVVIDLEKTLDIHEINADFLFYPLSWIFVPKRVVCYVSEDNVEWTEIASKTYENEASLAECKIVPFSFTALHGKGRYVRVKAESLLTNPEWHRGVGQPCWIFCDEVRIK